jgi:hypothetical protein
MLYDGILPIFRDEEDEVLDLLEAHFDGRDLVFGTETPDNLPEVLAGADAFVRIGRVGGATQDNVSDRPVVDVDVLGITRRKAKDTAKEIEQFLVSKPHPIDSCNVLIAPQKVEWAEQTERNVKRYFASYHLNLRR